MHPRLLRPLAALAAAAIALVLAAPVPALGAARGHARARYIYWTNGPANDMSVGRASISGGGKNNGFIRAAAVGNAAGIAVDGKHLYWGTANGGTATNVARANLNGAGVDTAFITGGQNPCGVAINASHLYWAGDLGDFIGRANLDGTGVRRNFLDVGTRVCWVAVNRTYIYWSNYQTGEIGRARLNGTGVNLDFIGGANGAFAINGSFIYFGDAGGIGRAKLNGSEVKRNFITGVLPAGTSMSGLAVDSSHIYWASYHGTTIGRANLNGTGKNTGFITGTTGTFGIALTP
jgi:hypothetical protein